MPKFKDKLSQMHSFSNNVLNPFTVDIISNTEALVCGSKGIIEYSDSTVKINCGEITVIFQGNDININSLSSEEIIIKGQLIRIDFINY
mgnify:CR=1 FL=1